MTRTLLIATTLFLLLSGTPVQAGRVKDLADVQGVRDNQLLGLGIVVGLKGTGDSAPFLSQALANVLKRYGLNVSPQQARSKNAAVVYVTATLPPFARPGAKLDVTCSSAGDASSLTGGTLLRVPLEGADSKVYAVAQGPVSVGGFAFTGDAASEQRNHPTVGRVVNGALVERSVPTSLLAKHGRIVLNLRRRSFLTAQRLASKIGQLVGVRATAVDGGTVHVHVPERARRPNDLVALLAKLGELEVEPDAPARVVINERTGTIVAGQGVRISKVAISHGNLTISVTETPEVSQPAPFSRKGETAVVPRTKLSVTEERPGLAVLEGGITVAGLAQALNSLGVSPRDLIAIFQALKVAGALHAELVVM